MKIVRFTPGALKSLRRHRHMAARVRQAIGDHAAEAGAHANNVTRLLGLTTFRLRVGDFRVIFEETATDIIVTRIGPRGGVYD